MSKWTVVPVRVTQEEKEQLKKFTKDYAKFNNIKDNYTLNKHLRHSLFTFMKSFYKKQLKIKELENQLKLIQEEITLIKGE